MSDEIERIRERVDQEVTWSIQGATCTTVMGDRRLLLTALDAANAKVEKVEAKIKAAGAVLAELREEWCWGLTGDGVQEYCGKFAAAIGEDSP